ncbi:type I-E CRISPR-associated protein Cas7/Cse4/CasC [Corynebacterium felinum]|uniref:CRISPR system Cascade subunit CasC n=1 Tax=Corynebacterium felinum TaxID=131318 RepID=A0ABU2B4W8_9CORY|nr:type I-E CRISPR-associated protein Cas7/Cse4/CasC [Corynebacterium felinum]MDF5820574.1 type I-E CRISPR-associated protein Cas7/Cse4/CasC [Corynebacterium felinum]MDR7353657.1 CRISPR system Cascade subunit CasC [Corynebacterium felinum]WJY95836.1 CRISPR system Cascade subunit CasC [Corynebacterium felinum]
MSTLFIDFHAIQAIGPANINRDDSGSPKSTVFGGVRRTRVSSQAWKRAIRKKFEEVIDYDKLGERTVHAVDRIAAKIVEKQPDLQNEAEKLAQAVLKAGGINTSVAKKNKADKEAGAPDKLVTGYLLFLSRAQIESLANLAISAHLEADGKFDKKAVKAAINDHHSIDVALFGRMIADSSDLNADACCQVAHAVSVHPMESEYDYFTAVDDNAPEGNAGAGMIGTVEFNSSTLYRYATINVPALINSLGSVEAAASAVGTFAQAFAITMPTGKQNTFANRTRPEFFAVSLRYDQPVNLVDVFEDAITVKSGRMKEATTRLVQHALSSDEAYGVQATSYYLATGGAALASSLEDFGESHTLPEIVSLTESAVRAFAEEN